MKIICNYEYEPCFKVYKMSESIENKYYYGKTRQPIHLRMKQHRDDKLFCDVHFGNVGWKNVTCEVIEACKDEEDMNLKEQKHINQGKLDPKCCLNIGSGIIRYWDDEEKAYVIKIEE